MYSFFGPAKLALHLCRKATIQQDNQPEIRTVTMQTYHTQLSNEDVGNYALLVRDSKRAQKVSEFLQKAEMVGQNREFVTYRGLIANERVIAISTGIGGPATAIVVEELHELGVHTIIKVGMCISMQPHITNGAIIIPYGVVRGGKTAHEYIGVEYPAVPHPEILLALKRKGKNRQKPLHLGIIYSKDAFFKDEPEKMPDSEGIKRYWKILRRANVIASEMESDTLFVIAAIREMRAGAVFTAIGPSEDQPPTGVGIDTAIHVAIEALKEIILKDNKQSPPADHPPTIATY